MIKVTTLDKLFGLLERSVTLEMTIEDRITEIQDELKSAMRDLEAIKQDKESIKDLMRRELKK